ncbi:hypothetical protein SFUMM280S_00266 [Streptomyces fumanus]
MLLALVGVAAGRLACQISTNWPRTGRPARSRSRPETVIRSPIGSPACCRVRSLSTAVRSRSPKAGEASSTSSGSLVTSMLTGGCFGCRSTEERYGA